MPCSAALFDQARSDRNRPRRLTPGRPQVGKQAALAATDDHFDAAAPPGAFAARRCIDAIERDVARKGGGNPDCTVPVAALPQRPGADGGPVRDALQVERIAIPAGDIDAESDGKDQYRCQQAEHHRHRPVPVARQPSTRIASQHRPAPLLDQALESAPRGSRHGL